MFHDDKVPVDELLIQWRTCGKAAHVLLAQLVYHVGRILEGKIIATRANPAISIEGRRRGRPSARFFSHVFAHSKRLLGLRVLAGVEVATRCMQYVYSAKTMFSINPNTFLAVALDTSRVVKQEWMLGMRAFPHNHGVWSTPQVRYVQCM